MASAGTVTVRLVAVAAVTVPARPPEPLNTTVFEPGVVWKFVPVIVIAEPVFCFTGVKLVIVGAFTVKVPPVTLP